MFKVGNIKKAHPRGEKNKSVTDLKFLSTEFILKAPSQINNIAPNQNQNIWPGSHPEPGEMLWRAEIQ